MFKALLSAAALLLTTSVTANPIPRGENALAQQEMLRKATVSILQKQCEEVMGWNWNNDNKSPHQNIGGPIALALLKSYEKDPQPTVWITLSQYTMHLKKIYTKNNKIPYRADIEYLALFANKFKDKVAAALSKDFFERIRSITPNGRDEFNRILEGRKDHVDLIGYEASLGIRAALALGETTYARDLANTVISHGAVKIADENNPYQILSVGSFIYALSMFADKTYQGAIERLAKRLESIQKPNGAWAFNNTQATAYALLGLTGANEAIKSQIARQKALQWLHNSQLKTGGWAIYNDGLPEPFVGPSNTHVQAETLQAILAGI